MEQTGYGKHVSGGWATAERPRNSYQGLRSGNSAEYGQAEGPRTGEYQNRKDQEIEKPDNSQREQRPSRGMRKQKIWLNWKDQKGLVCWGRACRISNFVGHQGPEENLRHGEKLRHQGARNRKNGKDEPGRW